MEILTETQDDSSGANPRSVKSEDGSPPPDGDRGSPPPNCAICLGRCRNKSFTDSCLHQFCFKCLVTWSKVKTECPLCKQNFKSIIHNVQPNQQYEEYQVEQQLHEEERIDIDDLVTATRRFRYRTTLTFPRGGDLAIQRLLMRYTPLTAMVGMPREVPGITPAVLPSSRRRRSPNSFRRTVYRHNLWARPLPDFTRRHRDCTPEFYRYNESQMNRLVPWLNRELHYLLLENTGHIAYVLQRILELLPQYHITSPEFREEMYRYFGSRTDHFLHELHCFASTPYDLPGYDRSVQYTTDSRVYINTVNDISSTDTDSDSDVVEVLDTAINRQNSAPLIFRPVSPILSPYEPSPGTATRRLPEPVYPLNLITAPPEGNRLAQNNIIPIETISHSDTDDDEVMVTGYIKPPHQRTPEVVDLRDSDNDSDVIVTEASAAPPRFPVKLTLSRPRAASPSDSDESYTPPDPSPRNRRQQSSSISFSEISSESSPSYSSSSTTNEEDNSDGNTDKHKAKKRSSKARSSRRKRRLSKERKREASTKPIASTSAMADMRERRHAAKRLKRKSTNGIGVKSSRRHQSADERSSELMEVDGLRPVTPSANDNDNTELQRRVKPTPEVQDEPQPGPSSSRAEREMKLSRRDGNKESRRIYQSADERSSKLMEVDGLRPVTPPANDNDNTKLQRRVEPTPEVQNEPQPGPSSSRAEREMKQSRRDGIKESRRIYQSADERSSKLMEVDGLRPVTPPANDNNNTTLQRRVEPAPEVQNEPQPGPSSSRAEKEMKQSRRDDNKESRRIYQSADERSSKLIEVDGLRPVTPPANDNDNTKLQRRVEPTPEVQNEPQPGPSSSRAEREMKLSRRDDNKESRRTNSAIGGYNSGSSRSSKGGKSSRRDEPSQSKKTESRTAQEHVRTRSEDESTVVKGEPQPGPSSWPDVKVKSFRRHEPSESKRAEPSKLPEEQKPESSFQSSTKGKSSRRDESYGSKRAELASRSTEQLPKSRKEDPSETERAESRTVHVESQPEPSSRGKGIKSSKRDPPLELRKPEFALQDDSQSDTPRFTGKGSKSSRRGENAEYRSPPSDARTNLSQAGPSNLKRKTSDVTDRRNKRLKSVVKKANVSSSTVVPRKVPASPDCFTDSDDDIPLNLTIHRSAWVD